MNNVRCERIGVGCLTTMAWARTPTSVRLASGALPMQSSRAGHATSQTRVADMARFATALREPPELDSMPNDTSFCVRSRQIFGSTLAGVAVLAAGLGPRVGLPRRLVIRGGCLRPGRPEGQRARITPCLAGPAGHAWGQSGVALSSLWVSCVHTPPSCPRWRLRAARAPTGNIGTVEGRPWT